MTPIRILLQTTIPSSEDDWSIARFSLVARELSRMTDVEVTARNRATASDDPVLLGLDESQFDEVWIIGADSGKGLSSAERAALVRFRGRGGGLLTARDHQDLGSSLAELPGPGAANYFHSVNLDPVEENRRDDDRFTKSVTWPNYHSGRNGNLQRIRPIEPLHPLLRRGDGTALELFPSHPHEGAIGVPAGESARVIACGRSEVTGKSFNLVVAFEGSRDLGRAVVESSFHHFADYNWDTRMGAPSFVEDPEGTAVTEHPELLQDVRTYVRNVARWLAGPPGAATA